MLGGTLLKYLSGKHEKNSLILRIFVNDPKMEILKEAVNINMEILNF